MTKAGFLFFTTLLFITHTGFTQDSSAKTTRIAFFAPLYLDSAFDASGNYRLGKTVPRYINAGLDFYQGAALAIDSLDKEGLEFDLQVYDTKNKTSIYELADNGAFNDVDLIIGTVSGSEYLDLATIAREKQIPFVSATYPNDGGISGNPFVIIVNSKLNTHLQAIYNYVLRNLGTNNIVMFRRQNAADDRITEVFKSLNASSSGQVLNIKTNTLNAAFTPQSIAASLDKARENVIICGSLDESFSKKLIAAVGTLASTYKITLVGMPTWEDYRELEAAELRTLPVIYSSTFFNPGEEHAWSTYFSQQYAVRTYSAPSEMAFRGYEVMYLFAHLATQFNDALLQHLSDKNHHVLTDFDFRPIHWSKNGTTPDYYENKRVYILQQLTDTLSKLN
ncbi:ABC transporter substrate-binding protein [Agriterribacter sp.]|uniref:ABC transporter substrate-binding protein n=1 Tax=Agriterribacter sp. TaxID=2821509 RepID=UPI002CD25CA4|nr:ABC transporter substrate-binding protein [Agriterribacter sp.]HRP56202.1 ABC transporter substrate-binding protein [Agriterribacter sp.]